MSVKGILDAYDIAAIVRELKELEECYLDKIYQYDDELFFKIRGIAKKELFARAGTWLCATVNRPERDDHPPTFAMTLRKYLTNSRIDRIEQYRFDRIVIMELSREQRYRLVFEIFPKGNIVLLEENENIIMPLFYQRWAHRVIKQGEIYLFPPSKLDIRSATLDEFLAVLQNDTDVVRGLVKLGMPGTWAEELCYRTSIEKNRATTSLTVQELTCLYTAIRNLTDKIDHGALAPEIVMSEGNVIDVTPLHLSLYDPFEHHEFETMNEACDAYYQQTIRKDRTAIAGHAAMEKKEQILRRLQQQQDAIEQYKIEADLFRKKGDALFANYGLIERLLAGDLPPKKCSYPHAVIELPFGDEILDVKVDLTKNVYENANLCYEQSKKMRDKVSGAQEALQQTFTQLNAIEIPRSELKSRPLAKTFWFEHFRWFIAAEGNVVVAGKDARSNERVVKKYLGDNDMYAHADVHGAPSCVIKAQDIEGNALPISEKTLKEACIFAASYSKAWKQYTTASAYWVGAWQVSRTPESGDFLPKGAFMIRGKRQYEKCDLLIALGPVSLKGERKIMGGPLSALKKHANRWVVLVPGQIDKSEIAHLVAQKLSCSVEEVQTVLPPGSATVMEEHL